MEKSHLETGLKNNGGRVAQCHQLKEICYAKKIISDFLPRSDKT
jgi:hypothetical protein